VPWELLSLTSTRIGPAAAVAVAAWPRKRRHQSRLKHVFGHGDDRDGAGQPLEHARRLFRAEDDVGRSFDDLADQSVLTGGLSAAFREEFSPLGGYMVPLSRNL
jgi:hypothetical protein